MKSIFTDKDKQPDNDDLKEALGETWPFWQEIRNYVLSEYPAGYEEWSFSSYGWNFRIKDKKRAIIYLLPRDKFFKAAFVFGQKATDTIMNSQVEDSIKTELSSARVYAEGRGIRIDIMDNSLIGSIKELIDIKLAN